MRLLFFLTYFTWCVDHYGHYCFTLFDHACHGNMYRVIVHNTKKLDFFFLSLSFSLSLSLCLVNASIFSVSFVCVFVFLINQKKIKSYTSTLSQKERGDSMGHAGWKGGTKKNRQDVRNQKIYHLQYV